MGTIEGNATVTILETYTNAAEDGIAAQVALLPEGARHPYSVTLRDTDAGERFPTVLFFDVEIVARRRAQEIVNGQPAGSLGE